MASPEKFFDYDFLDDGLARDRLERNLRWQ
jgi:hypothetical protein